MYIGHLTTMGIHIDTKINTCKFSALDLVIKNQQTFLQNFIKLSKFTSKNATVLSIRFFLGSVFHRLNDINKNYLLKPFVLHIFRYHSEIYISMVQLVLL